MKSYDQYCPLARALDVVGDRWAMLIMRELVLSPKRFTDLEQRLDGIAPNLLSRRLKELEAAGVVRRRRLDPPAASTVYELTEKAAGLETAMLELARWGVQFLGPYEGNEAFEFEWLLPVMEEFADKEAARRDMGNVRVPSQRDRVLGEGRGRRGDDQARTCSGGSRSPDRDRSGDVHGGGLRLDHAPRSESVGTQPGDRGRCACRARSGHPRSCPHHLQDHGEGSRYPVIRVAVCAANIARL